MKERLGSIQWDVNVLKMGKDDTPQNLETKSHYNSEYKEQHNQNQKERHKKK